MFGKFENELYKNHEYIINYYKAHTVYPQIIRDLPFSSSWNKLTSNVFLDDRLWNAVNVAKVAERGINTRNCISVTRQRIECVGIRISCDLDSEFGIVLK